ncbi:MAG: twin-arginine translocation signal domain-containing protein, partial [Polyangiaceae bacterium]|nr:twin-arginine translocation signal domain-containing protein [Polyangiaceae bacterium]
MNKPSRRTFLKLLGGSAALAAAHGPLMRAFAEGNTDQFFIFIHAAGGWDVTLWSDPRNEMAGLVEPASTDNTDIAGLAHWKSKPLNSMEIDADTFELVKPM